MTNLSDFLKVKTVRCVSKNAEDNLTIGKKYKVTHIIFGLQSDNNAKGFYDFDSFEPVIESAENPLQDMKLTPEFETEASEPKFKVGDKVYTGIDEDIKVIKQVKEKFVVAPSIPFLDTHYPISEVCHATSENHEMLCKLYPHIKFEQPPKPLSGDDIVKAMLKKGIKNVLCLWGNGDKIIIDRLSYKGGLMSTNCNIVGGLTPIDWYTGEPLTESILND